MARGGHRERAGRPSRWTSSSETRAIRVPEWMADNLLSIARKLDIGESLDNVQKQIAQGQEQDATEKLKAIVQDWSDRASGKETSPRWKNAASLIEELNEVLKDI